MPGRNAITVSIEINDSFYCKSDIKKELEQCFDQILKNYDSKTNNEKEEATSFPEFQNGLRAFGGMPLSH